MHFPIWLIYALIALIFWGITGVTQKLSTNHISTQLSFLWFAIAFVPIALVILASVSLDWHLTTKVFALAVIGGALNGLGAYTSFAALEHGGKASIVIPLVYLYPLVTIVLAIVFLHEKLTGVQIAGIVLAIGAAILLSRETPASESSPR
ncbi:MAG: EamA family transporter [Terriglobia bacterium]